MRAIDKLVPVTETVKGEVVRVPNLYQRGAGYYMAKQINGKRYLRALPAWADDLRTRKKWIADESKRLEKGEDITAQRREARSAERIPTTIAILLACYRAAALRRGRPDSWTVERNCRALLKVIEDGLGVDTDRANALGVDCLTIEVVDGFAKAMMKGRETKTEQASAMRSILSYLAQARSIFGRNFLDEYAHLNLPDLGKFLRRRPVDDPGIDRRSFTAAEVATLRSGADLKKDNPAIYGAWFAGYYLALRAGEIAQVRPNWLREHEVTDMEREAGGTWIGGRKTVWVLDVGADPDARIKTAASAAAIPVADDVADELRAILKANGGWLVPGATFEQRRDVVIRDLSAWFGTKGWTRNHRAHELRSYRQQIWRGKYGEMVREAWARHKPRGCGAHYVPQLCLSARPLGLAE